MRLCARARARAREPEVGILIEGEIITGNRSLLTAGTFLRCFAFIGACSVLQKREDLSLGTSHFFTLLFFSSIVAVYLNIYSST
jgi:hypothetical protein